MQTLEVALGDRGYPIVIGRNLIGNAHSYADLACKRQVLVVTNSTIAPLYLDTVVGALDDDKGTGKIESLVLPDGEAHKNLATAEKIFDALMQGHYARDCLLVALGGGVIGDITGFAAATYQRGVDFLQIPTTLLAQVDSSVGGKTGVNHPLGKNMIGAFHQPRRVLADTSVLQTLPPRELAAGLAEVIKYGLIRDLPFLQWLEQNLSALLAQDDDALAYAITQSCRNKAEVVAADERESGQRALLNLGHTFGHAIEAGLGYGHWLHGEAVAAGMCMAADLSVRMGWLSAADRERTLRLIAAAGLPTRAPDNLDIGRVRELMSHDKKVLGGRVRLIIPEKLGHARVVSDYPDDALDATLRAFFKP